MSLKKNQLEIINLLKEHEKVIEDLYRVYAKKFPKHREFWTTLARQENEHAKWIMKLTEKIEEGETYFNEERFTVEAIKSSISYIKKEKEKVGDETLLIEALSTAHNLESGLLEKEYFETVEGDSVELKHLLRRLASETAVHAKKVKGLLEKERKGN